MVQTWNAFRGFSWRIGKMKCFKTLRSRGQIVDSVLRPALDNEKPWHNDHQSKKVGSSSQDTYEQKSKHSNSKESLSRAPKSPCKFEGLMKGRGRGKSRGIWQRNQNPEIRDLEKKYGFIRRFCTIDTFSFVILSPPSRTFGKKRDESREKMLEFRVAWRIVRAITAKFNACICEY